MDYWTEVDVDDIDVIDGVCCDGKSPTYCLEECRELIDIIMQEQQWQVPSTDLEPFRGSSLSHRQQSVQFLHDFFSKGNKSHPKTWPHVSPMPPSLRVRGPSSKTGQTVLATNVSKLLCIHFHAKGGVLKPMSIVKALVYTKLFGPIQPVLLLIFSDREGGEFNPLPLREFQNI